MESQKVIDQGAERKECGAVNKCEVGMRRRE